MSTQQEENKQYDYVAYGGDSDTADAGVIKCITAGMYKGTLRYGTIAFPSREHQELKEHIMNYLEEKCIKIIEKNTGGQLEGTELVKVILSMEY